MSDKEEVTSFELPSQQRTMKMADGFTHERPRAYTQEEKLRMDNPGLMELWEQYQTMLKLLTPADTKKLRGTAKERLAQMKEKFKG